MKYAKTIKFAPGSFLDNLNPLTQPNTITSRRFEGTITKIVLILHIITDPFTHICFLKQREHR